MIYVKTRSGPESCKWLEAGRTVERVSITASPILKHLPFEYMTEPNTGLLESLGIPSTGVIFCVVFLCAWPGKYDVLEALCSHTPSLRFKWLYILLMLSIPVTCLEKNWVIESSQRQENTRKKLYLQLKFVGNWTLVNFKILYVWKQEHMIV